MAGNIVKWWRQFKQYKQFSVLQECTTDSEELVNKNPSTYSPLSESQPLTNQNLHDNSEQLTPIPTDIQSQAKATKNVKVKELYLKDQKKQETIERLQKRHSIATTRHLEQLEANRIHFDDLSISLDDSNTKSQPIQFSFTLYDLDGHGKITKDDIAGIVSTIYDSIGKSVVVPHYGKKTINVKLTVSPDAVKNCQRSSASFHRSNKKYQLTPRRRYRARELISDEENDDGSESGTSDNGQLKSQNGLIHNNVNASEDVFNQKNNVYESINNLKCCNQSPTIENLYSKNIKNIEIYKNCQGNSSSNSPDRLFIQENDEILEKNQQKHSSSGRKKLLRKQRSRRQRPTEKPLRVRSLSVGNDNKWRKRQDINEQNTPECNKNCELNNSSNLRRHELIEIIRESMEKNRLCFQNNKKTNNISGMNQTRQRSNTVTCTNKMMTAPIETERCTELDQHHLCAFDSILHATICSNVHTPLENGKMGPKVNNRSKMKQMNHTIPQPALKLKTSVLNQLNPNLTPEQKLTRKLNDVEKWLFERENDANDLKNRAKDDKNIHNPIIVDKFTQHQSTSTPKKVFNKEILTSKKTRPLPHHSKEQKEAINSSKNQILLEYSASECENLISMSEDEQSTPTAIHVNNKTESQQEESTSKSSSVRFVHIHHHFYHFDEKDNQIVE